VTEGFAVVAAAILSNIGWMLGMIPVLVFLPLLFPDGRLPSRRWLLLLWFDVALIVFLLVGGLFGEHTLTGSWEGAVVANPLYMSGLPELNLPDAIFDLLLLGVLIGSVASLIVRFRRSRGVERQQIKWF